MTDPREQIQEAAKAAFLTSDRKNTIILGTGGGKSKVAIDILKELNPEGEILLLTNSQELRDNNWKAEFEKFGYPWDKITSECYQTAYRWSGRKFSVIIADEFDFMAEEYIKVLQNNEYDVLLGLTGFMTEEKEEFLTPYAPICFRESTQSMQEAGILNKSEIIFIEYNLSKAKSIAVPTKNKKSHFYTSENDTYKYWDKEFDKARVVKSLTDKKYFLSNAAVRQSMEKTVKSAEWRFKITAAKRKAVLNNLDSSVRVVHNLVEHIHSTPGNKIIVFSALTKQCDRMINSFHGKSEIGSADLEKLNSGEINTMSVCKKINRGVNMAGVNYLIKESFDGSEVDFHQTHGRLMRLRPDQTAKYLVLVPHYEEMIKKETGVGWERRRIPTQAKVWASKMMDKFEAEVRTIRLLDDYSLPTGIRL